MSSGFSKFLLDRPNHVIEHQRYYQQRANVPLFLRGPRDKLFVFGTLAVLGTGLCGALYGVTRMARGIKN
ncbi:hypothetical protein BDB01DRAFT_849106 [Pilobolus umbonatus]|nr:hypothetical protein BDB01DRAFT_849106 [Pilobolus umbonatus]